MGLTIHYTLSSQTRSGQKARAMVAALRQKCLDLPFAKVGELLDLSGDQCDFKKREKEDPLRWFLIQTSRHVNFVWRTGSDYELHAFAPDKESRMHYSTTVPPCRILGFTARPGEGCEQSNVGLCLYPPTVTVNDGHGTTDTLRTGLRGWQWSSFCKTQYANDPAVGGMPHFLGCHLTVIAMLDAAKEVGLTVEVTDESEYWQKRDIRALAKVVGEWDKMIAAGAGALRDALGEGIQTAMDGRPDFESLEAHASEDTAEAARQLARIVASLKRKSPPGKRGPADTPKKKRRR